MPENDWQKVREVFDAARQRPPALRSSFAREACGDDEAMLAEVTSLLASLDGGKEFLETPAVGLVAIGGNSLETGQKLGHYEIVRAIGAGGMGEVYLAQDTRLRRRVAIKVLSDRFGQKAPDLDRFIREARSASALNHPNIMVVHEVGAEQGTHFIVSEYIEGRTLRDLLNDAQLPVNEAIDIAIQTAAGLAAAHKAHLVHRDIKPENIMVRPDGVVKVLDFGLSKLVEERNMSFLGPEDPTIKHQQTEKGVILGTIAYMSPEQARAKDIDERTDIWSLGVVIYEMLSGRSPFAAETTGDAISAILTRNLPPLTDDGIPPELQRIVGKTLRKNREERYQHIRDLLIDLKDLKQEIEFDAKRSLSDPLAVAGGLTREIDTTEATRNAPTRVRKAADRHTTSSAEYIVSGIKQHRRAAGAISALLLTAAVGIAYLLFTARQSGNLPQIGSIAVMPFANESGNADIDYLSDGLTETLISSLSQLQNLDVKAHSSVIRYKGKDTTANSIARDLNVHAFLNGKVRQRGSDLSLYVELVDVATEKAIWSQTYDRPMSNLVALQKELAYDVVGKLRSKLSGEDEQRLARSTTSNPEAYRLLMLGNYHVGKRTETEIRRGIEYLERAVTLDQNYAAAHAAIATAYIALPNYSKVPFPEVMPKVREATLKALALDDDLSEAHTLLGFIMSLSGDNVAEEREYKRAIELNPNSALAYAFYSNFYRIAGKPDEALEMQRRAVELDPLSLVANREYGSKLYFARRYDEAIAQFNKTIELDPSFASAHYGLAVVHWAKGDHAEAVEGHARYHELTNEPAKAALLRESFARGGWMDFLQTITDESKQFNLAGNLPAPYYAAMGDKDKAFASLNNFYATRRIRPGSLMDPRLDPLRGDQRFDELLRRAV